MDDFAKLRILDARLAAARVEGIREGMEQAALWLEETNLTEGWIARKLAEALRAAAKEVGRG